MRLRKEIRRGSRPVKSTEVVLDRPEQVRDKQPYDPRIDDEDWDTEVESSIYLRLRPELRERARAEYGQHKELFSDLVPRNYSIEDHLGQLSFRWLNGAADFVQVFPELRQWKVPGLDQTFSQVAFEQIKPVAERGRSLRGAPYDLNYARLLRPALEICLDKRAEIYGWLEHFEFRENIEFLFSGEDPVLRDEFSFVPESGWIEGLAAVRVLFPDLNEKIQQFLSDKWGSIRASIQEEDDKFYAKRQIVAASILGAANAWIDETGEFHIEFPHPKPLAQPKPLPARTTL